MGLMTSEGEVKSVYRLHVSHWEIKQGMCFYTDVSTVVPHRMDKATRALLSRTGFFLLFLSFFVSEFNSLM